MKGIVFTELIEMVEHDLGIRIADRMISSAQSEHGGAYTATGTYDHGELIRMVVSLSEETNTPVPELVRTFGRHLFGRFRELYPAFFENSQSSVDFLPLVESYIHKEVRKLYPDAELPSFECESDEIGFTMTYRSKRPFADLAEGLILACVEYFGDSLRVERTDLGEQDGTEAEFFLTSSSTPASTPVS